MRTLAAMARRVSDDGTAPIADRMCAAEVHRLQHGLPASARVADGIQRRVVIALLSMGGP